jgi:DNA-binding GntR family transcriptional regulator
MINSQSVADQTAKFIEGLIISGKLRAGQKIREQDISDQLGVSRFPIREAFKILEAGGLVYREPRRGIFVSKVEDKDIWEIYTLKICLYTLAVTLAMEKITDRDIKKLEKTVLSMERIVESPDPNISKYQDLNDLFHVSTIEIAGHGRLKRIIEGLNNQIRRLSYKSLSSDKEYLRKSCSYHRRILDAIRNKDTRAAEDLTREHIAKGLERLQSGDGF